MGGKSAYTLVGAFVLILSAVFIWGILWISAGGAPQNFERYVVFMGESVSGLNVDAPVKYRGVDVGKVEQIGIDYADPERVRLLLQVRQGTPIKEDTVASLEYQGLTGIANVNLSGGKADSADLKRWPGQEYPVITGRPSIFSNLDTTLEGVVGTLMETSAGINAMLSEENRSNVARSLENVAVLTENFAEQAKHLETIVAHLETTLKNAREASVDFPHMVQEFTRSAEAVTQMADEIRGIGENLSAASARIEETVDASSDGLVDFTRTALPEITEMIYELKQASENLRQMSEALAQNPSLLIYGAPEPKPGPGE